MKASADIAQLESATEEHQHLRSMIEFNPLDYPIALAYPHRIANTSWMAHVPFAMFLVDVVRPNILVELGTLYGVSYCAFCQAIKALNIDCKCYGIDRWSGDSHVGDIGPEVLQDLMAYHDPRYGSFSRLIRSTFSDALVQFEDGCIDLLHIDGLHTYAAVKDDFEGWHRKLSRRGIVLFHDTNVRERDFGVWKYWCEVKHQYPHFEMIHGHGLGLLLVGAEPPPLLLNIANSSKQTQACIREYFYRLGSGVEAYQEVKVLERRVREQTDDILELLDRQRNWAIRIILAWLRYGPVGFVRQGLAKAVTLVVRRKRADAASVH